ncbi:TolB-like translocation protein [Crossiella cryophila]|uniref:Tol biopolymer transport system component n=1 Tax=Crossiella cryophila TaxID=43355 RepID=A0A7W7FWV9_9PSEU|nr:PD40 domain-containing protein [Crossiella cryophila]MBB4680003.1 Tol biopolymer transport system component [Crossiella cryophila]
MRRPVTTALVAALLLSPPGVTTRLSSSTVDVALSADGRYAALVRTEQNGQSNVYIQDNHSGTQTLISKGHNGPANGDSRLPSLSADGRYVAFETTASNLGTTDTDPLPDVVVCDREGGPSCVYAGRPKSPSRPTASHSPALSADGSVLLWVHAPVLTFSLQAANGTQLARTRLDKDQAGRLQPPTRFELVDTAPPGSTATGVGRPAISADGRHGAVITGLREQPETLVALSLTGGQPTRLHSGGQLGDPVLSGDGAKVAFTAGRRVLVHDRGTGTSRDVTGEGTEPTLSTDGRYLAFVTAANVVTRDLIQDERRTKAGLPPLPPALTSPSIRQTCPDPPCPANGPSRAPRLAPDGSAVAFISTATDLVEGTEPGGTFLRRFTPTLTPDPAQVTAHGADPTVAVLRHNGFGPLPITGVRVTGDFEVFPAETCSARILHAGEECLVSVRFHTRPSTDRTGRLEVQTAGGLVVVPLSDGPGGPGGLLARPSEVDFGPALVTTPGQERTVDLHNTGTVPVRTHRVALVDGGPHFSPGDYALTTTCDQLPAGGTCPLRIRHTPLGMGPRPAVLEIEHTGRGGRELVLLTGAGTAGVVTASPAVGRPGSVITLTGHGFPPGAPVTITLAGGPERTTAVPGPDGTFRAPLLIFPSGRPGLRTLSAISTAGSPPVRAERPLLVQPGSLTPPDLVTRR